MRGNPDRERAAAPLDRSADFGPFDGRTWLDSAALGPLPRVAAEVAVAEVARRRAPHRLGHDAFAVVPRRLREALGELVGVPPGEVILGNSTTYGLNLLVQGIPWRDGDEVLVVEGDFPTSVVTWLPLRRQGVRVRRLVPSGGAANGFGADELAAALRPETRVFCTSWVFSFSGHALDLEPLGRLCRERGVTFVVNGSQAVGARPLDLGRLPVDALVSCGSKWLCGPYATGFCWLAPPLAASLRYRQAYWFAQPELLGDLDQGWSYELPDPDTLGAARFDVFCSGNFLNFAPWTAAVRYLLELGIERVAAHDQALVERLLAGLDLDRYRLRSPRSGPQRSTLVLLSHADPERNAAIHAALAAAGVDVSLRAGALRLSPHVHNTVADIDRALAALADCR
jgi:selenocysteine lyase/cysteine desulfurase